MRRFIEQVAHVDEGRVENDVQEEVSVGVGRDGQRSVQEHRSDDRCEPRCYVYARVQVVGQVEAFDDLDLQVSQWPKNGQEAVNEPVSDPPAVAGVFVDRGGEARERGADKDGWQDCLDQSDDAEDEGRVEVAFNDRLFRGY